MANKFVIGDRDEEVAAFVCAQIPNMALGDTPYTAIGQMNDAGIIVGGVVFNNFTNRDVHLHTAGIGPHWLSRRFIGEIFRYVFFQLGCRRCTGLVAATNVHAQRFDQALGFKYEGILRAYLANDEDVYIYGMLREECRWLKTGELKHGTEYQPRQRGHGRQAPSLRRNTPADRIRAALDAGIAPLRPGQQRNRSHH